MRKRLQQATPFLLLAGIACGVPVFTRTLIGREPGRSRSHLLATLMVSRPQYYFFREQLFQTSDPKLADDINDALWGSHIEDSEDISVNALPGCSDLDVEFPHHDKSQVFHLWTQGTRWVVQFPPGASFNGDTLVVRASPKATASLRGLLAPALTSVRKS